MAISQHRMVPTMAPTSMVSFHCIQQALVFVAWGVVDGEVQALVFVAWSVVGGEMRATRARKQPCGMWIYFSESIVVRVLYISAVMTGRTAPFVGSLAADEIALMQKKIEELKRNKKEKRAAKHQVVESGTDRAARLAGTQYSLAAAPPHMPTVLLGHGSGMVVCTHGRTHQTLQLHLTCRPCFLGMVVAW